ncbi:hypothetical protein PPERSA_00642 [Pseudocohnilembus persalinus]|uniref:Uncharacterized protein n=1 Tax=Pseudocohnilembus persalinus TaxID=266149 RepID=A0A0V0QT67_PSEPJ|nr:hypothetical protein PPERSA_00642 [Pseudocohnilembus persalinus]|eukprot:KRX05341.1 hypothetical protein PPERSA_00642 [Pseudocohnilembus persalinus]
MDQKFNSQTFDSFLKHIDQYMASVQNKVQKNYQLFADQYKISRFYQEQEIQQADNIQNLNNRIKGYQTRKNDIKKALYEDDLSDDLKRIRRNSIDSEDQQQSDSDNEQTQQELEENKLGSEIMHYKIIDSKKRNSLKKSIRKEINIFDILNENMNKRVDKSKYSFVSQDRFWKDNFQAQKMINNKVKLYEICLYCNDYKNFCDCQQYQVTIYNDKKGENYSIKYDQIDNREKNEQNEQKQENQIKMQQEKNLNVKQCKKLFKYKQVAPKYKFIVEDLEDQNTMEQHQQYKVYYK